MGLASDMAASLAEPATFKVIFERRVDGIFRYLSFRAGQAAAEDLTAETFAHAFAGRSGYQPERGSVRSWLYGIATNVLRHHRRDELRRMEALTRAGADSESQTDSTTQVIERLRLVTALASLGPASRNVVLLIGLGGLTYEETAAILQIPIGTVRSQYSRARTQLVASLSEPTGPEVTGGAVS